jgi:AsmA protein
MSKSGKIATVLAGLIVLAIVAIPNLLSTSYVKQRVADQLSQLTGRHVALEGSSSVSLRPYLGVSYDNVIFSDSRDVSGKPLISIEVLKARLGLFAALVGDAQLTEVELIRPHFNLRIDSNGKKNWLPDQGQIGAHISKQVPGDDLRLGTIRIEDGIAELFDESRQETHQLTAITGSVSWPNIGATAKAEISSVWRGEIMNLTASVADPLAWLRNEKSEISVKLSSKPLIFSLDGTTDRNSLRSEGNLSASTPSPKRLADWLGWQVAAIQKLDASSISGVVATQGNGFEFPEASISIAGHEGQGSLQLTRRDDGLFAINGTVAFNTIALPEFNSLWAASPLSTDSSEYDLSILQGIALDVRLSAKTASTAPFSMSNLAASVIVKDGRAGFDIGHAEIIGGTVVGSINLQKLDDSISAAANFTLSDIELGELTRMYKQSSISLQGKGAVDLKLKATGRDADGLMLRLNGEGNIRGTDGVMTGLDLRDLMNSANSGANTVSRISTGSTEYSDIVIGFFIANGTAFLRDSTIASNDVKVGLKGRVDLVRTTLALRGEIQATADSDDTMQNLSFFVGGTASSPLFVPLPAANRVKSNPSEQQNTPGQ